MLVEKRERLAGRFLIHPSRVKAAVVPAFQELRRYTVRSADLPDLLFKQRHLDARYNMIVGAVLGETGGNPA